MDEHNGTGNGRVRFGDAPGNSLDAAILPDVLREWHQRDPEGMGAIVMKVMMGVPPRARRKART